MHEFEPDVRDARLAHAEHIGGDGRKVDDSTCRCVQSAIDDRHDDVSAVVEIVDSHVRAERNYGVTAVTGT